MFHASRDSHHVCSLPLSLSLSDLAVESVHIATTDELYFARTWWIRARQGTAGAKRRTAVDPLTCGASSRTGGCFMDACGLLRGPRFVIQKENSWCRAPNGSFSHRASNWQLFNQHASSCQGPAEARQLAQGIDPTPQLQDSEPGTSPHGSKTGTAAEARDKRELVLSAGPASMTRA